MKIILVSWNVNGIRAVVKKGFAGFLRQYQPDILGLQEIKISDGDLKKLNKKFSAQGGPASGWDFRGYNEYWNPASRAGYSGTAVLSKLEPLSIAHGLGAKKFDDEGRVQTLEFERFYFVNCYFPNANHELSRLKFKEEFNEAFLNYVKKLEQRKLVVVTGDFNVAREEIDLARPKDNLGNAGFTPEERAWADQFIAHGLIDTFRHCHGRKIEYSWWSYRSQARARNIGWRIDYFLVSAALQKNIQDAFILDEVEGSDHAPVGLVLEF